MANALEIREELERLLAERISLDDFEDWFVPYSWNIHKHGDSAAQELAYSIEHVLSQFDEDSQELRAELSKLIPLIAQNRYGSPSQEAKADSGMAFTRVAA